MYLQRKFIFPLRLFMGSGRVVSYRLVFINAKKMRVGPNESFVEDATWKLVEMLFLKRFQVAAGNLG